MKSAGAAVRVILSAEQLSILDDWIESRPDPKPSRPEAIRRLITCAFVDHPGQ